MRQSCCHERRKLVRDGRGRTDARRKENGLDLVGRTDGGKWSLFWAHIYLPPIKSVTLDYAYVW